MWENFSLGFNTQTVIIIQFHILLMQFLQTSGLDVEVLHSTAEETTAGRLLPKNVDMGGQNKVHIHVYLHGF